ncbi:hypothetical protein PHLCEN_2v7958, partial [Hermanssonia centrifuga]
YSKDNFPNILKLAEGPKNIGERHGVTAGQIALAWILAQLFSFLAQRKLRHEVYGGIQAYVAMKAHQRNMPEAIRRALSDANISIEEVDGIAFTRGPGMGGCLGAGLMAAKGIAAALGKPLVGVHHMVSDKL